MSNEPEEKATAAAAARRAEFLAATAPVEVEAVVKEPIAEESAPEKELNDFTDMVPEEETEVFTATEEK